MAGSYFLASLVGISLFTTACAQQPENASTSDNLGVPIPEESMNVGQRMPNEMLLSPGGLFEDIQGRYLTREQMQDIRNQVVANGVRTVIRTIEPDNCVAPGAQFTINGSGFGDTQGSKRVWLSRRGVDIRSAAIVAWTDTQIVARASGADLYGRYYIGIKDGPSRYISNVTKDVNICPVEIPGVSVDFDPELAPIRLDCFDLDVSRLDFVCDDTCKIVDGDRVVHDYGIYIDVIAGGLPRILYSDMFFIIEGEFEQQCIGPTRATLFPHDAARRRESRPIVLWKKDGEFTTRAARNAVRSWYYNLECGDSTDTWTSDALSSLEIRRLEGNAESGYPDPTWAIGYPEVHGTDPDGEPREFWFNDVSRWDSESDANTFLRLLTESGIRTSCSNESGHYWRMEGFNIFHFWSSD